MREPRFSGPGWRWVMLAIAMAVCIGGATRAAVPPQGAKPKVRLNKIIEAVEQGRAAIRDEDWMLRPAELVPRRAGACVT